jgi:K(+)-stimulated pyrophosphate-energized sodium pump
MILGLSIFLATGQQHYGWIFFPLVMRAFGVFAAIVGIMSVRMRNEDEKPMAALNRGYYVTSILAAIFLYFVVDEMLGNIVYFYCGLIGIALSIIIVYITQYYTSGEWRPVKDIAKSSETGPATNIITGFSVGLETAAMPVIAICISLLATYALGLTAAPAGADAFVYGLYGTAVATMGMLATCAFILAEDTFGPITDNAGGIVEMSDQPEEVRKRTNRLDAVGNTTKALTKGYAMGSAALAAFLLFAAYFEEVAKLMNDKLNAVAPGSGTLTLADVFHVDIASPPVFVGAFIVAMLVFLFASLAIRAVGKAAHEMIAEVRRQFKEIPGILEGTAKPDYARCVDISTKGALKAMVLPGILPVIVPVGFGLILRNLGYIETVQAVGALLMVGTITGVLMATLMNNGGGAWDNAKKYIEAGHHGGKGTPAHAAAVVGDTVGDPFKDTAGPSLHVLVKLLSTVTLVFAALFVV